MKLDGAIAESDAPMPVNAELDDIGPAAAMTADSSDGDTPAILNDPMHEFIACAIGQLDMPPCAPYSDKSAGAACPTPAR